MKAAKRNNEIHIIAGGFPFILLLIIAFKALPALRHGDSVPKAVYEVCLTKGFLWGTIVPFSAFYLFLLFFAPWLRCKLINQGRRDSARPSWQRARWSYTLLGLGFLVLTGVYIGWPILKGELRLSWDKLAAVTLGWLAYFGWVITRWFMKPDVELIQAFETGEQKRFLDERRMMLLEKSAQTTLYWVMGLLLAAGTFYDLLVTRIWPVRTMVEFLAICCIWMISYRNWNKRL